MKQLTAAISLVMLAACQSTAPGQPQAEDQCGAQSHQNLVGTREADLNKSSLPKATRMIHPDSVVTMDYSAQRLNVYVGKDGKINRVTCG
ncbi:MAG TPA: I78 family peptidase inhibitor [Advenella sp.]|nr:I78 family peptidase inhibitor [Advenella sp.]